jgi:hypothetical protein
MFDVVFNVVQKPSAQDIKVLSASSFPYNTMEYTGNKVYLDLSAYDELGNKVPINNMQAYSSNETDTINIKEYTTSSTNMQNAFEITLGDESGTRTIDIHYANLSRSIH